MEPKSLEFLASNILGSWVAGAHDCLGGEKNLPAYIDDTRRVAASLRGKTEYLDHLYVEAFEKHHVPALSDIMQIMALIGKRHGVQQDISPVRQLAELIYKHSAHFGRVLRGELSTAPLAGDYPAPPKPVVKASKAFALALV